VSGTDERLNSLLDGELSPAEASDTAEALRNNPSLTARLADLARLRAITTAIDTDLPTPCIPPSPVPRPWQRPGSLMGGALIALSIVASILILLPAQEPPSLVAHRRFLATPADATGAAAGLPDLSAAGLRLARIEPVGGGTYAGYVGPRGCRLGLWLGPRDGAPVGGSKGWRSETVEQADGQVVWIAATPSMDAGRFAALAEVVRTGPAASATLLADASARSACLS
jgi:hypothetical protein